MAFNQSLAYLIFVLCLAQSKCSSSFDHQPKKAIRQDVLEGYDKVIGPVRFLREDDPLNISFSFTIYQLFDVKWHDPSLAWNSTKYGGTKFTVFSRHEIWVPDIAIKNNANEGEYLGGGRAKFITDVNGFSSGKLRWLSPATFTTICEQTVVTWPMDRQVCYLYFGSHTYNKRFMNVVPDDEYNTYKQGSVSNGQWVIDDVTVLTTSTKHNGCCGNFSVVKYKLTLVRKPKYFLFYLAPPVVILVILSVLSFIIPSQSGERISFITTILLSLIVFLETIPAYLPRSSDELPFFGILLILSLGVISFVLCATIFIVRCQHSEGRPSPFMKKLFYPFNSTKKIQATTPKQDAEKQDENQPSDDVVITIHDDNDDDVTWNSIAEKANWMTLTFILVATTTTAIFFVFN